MAAKILSKSRLGETYVWTLKGTFFTSLGVQFQIVGTESTGPGVYDCIHTVKNTESLKYKTIEMRRLIGILSQCDE